MPTPRLDSTRARVAHVSTPYCFQSRRQIVLDASLAREISLQATTCRFVTLFGALQCVTLMRWRCLCLILKLFMLHMEPMML